MKYNIKTSDIFGKSLKTIVLNNRNLTEDDIEKLSNYNLGEVTESPYKLNNMYEAVKLFMQEYDKQSNIGIVVDSDVDGMGSSALLYLFFKESNYPLDKIHIFHHEGKMHGISDEKLFKQIKKSNVEFLIIADAGTNDEKQSKELLNMNKKILILDHHLKDTDMKEVYKNQNGELIYVLVNNQLGDYCKCYSGAGVVWKFITALLEREWVHQDICAISNIADMMDINSDLELRTLVNKGLSNITNSLFKEFIKEANIENLTPMGVSFNISNYMNGVIRFGDIKDKEMLFRALIGCKEEFEYKPRKSKNNPNPQVEIESLQKHIVRLSKSIKQKQDKRKKECVELCKKHIEENNLDNNKVIVVIDKENKIVDKRITGLIATNLVDKYKKSVVLISYSAKQNKYIGSMRGYGIESFKDILESTEICKVMGHDNSAGVEVETKDIPRLIKRINKAMENIEILEPCIEVDCEIDSSISVKQMNDILALEHIWNSYCPKPLFLIKDVEIDTAKVRVPYPTLMVFKIGDIECKKEFCSKVFRETFLHEGEQKFGRPKIKADLIVEIGWDEYKKKPCFLLKYAESEIIKKENKKNDIPF